MRRNIRRSCGCPISWSLGSEQETNGWWRRMCCSPWRSSRRDRAMSTSTSSRASTRRQEFRITGSSTLTRLPRRSPCSTWARRTMATSRAPRPPVSSSRRRPSVCASISPRWSPRVPSPPNTKQSSKSSPAASADGVSRSISPASARRQPQTPDSPEAGAPPPSRPV